MSQNAIILLLADLVAICVLALVLYYPRHRRQDLALSFLAVNIGVLAVSTVLISSGTTAGLGLGLLGVLAIIRLRSSELDQHEIAYYFSALAIGVIGGLGSTIPVEAISLMAVIVLVVGVADAPMVRRAHFSQTVLLDAAYADRDALRWRLESLLNAEVIGLTLRKIDLVNDTTLVDVRYVVHATPTLAPAPSAMSPQPANLATMGQR
jgi:hypothetical protein